MRDFVLSSYTAGELCNLQCPVCLGGRGSEKSFNIFEVDDAVLGYRCHRSSCGATGRVPLLGTERIASTVQRSANLLLVKSTNEDVELYASQFRLTDPLVAVANDKRWFVVYLRRHDGTRFGWHRRVTDKTKLLPKEPKARTHKDEKYPLAFFRNSPYNTTLVVVEDPWSALRIESLQDLRCDAAAICGGDWTSDMATTVRGKYKRVILALDRDAQAKAITQAMRWGHIQQVRVVVPRVDIKNMEDNEIISTLT